jgi:hypothetical protein
MPRCEQTQRKNGFVSTVGHVFEFLQDLTSRLPLATYYWVTQTMIT